MEEIKVGEYIRTKEWGIAKVHKVDNGKVTWVKNKNNRATHYFTQLKEPSKDLIDLIEVGDYVNGFEVTQNAEDTPEEQCDGVYHKCIIVKQSFDGVKGWKMIDFDIETIVTKEQFESVEYKRGD